MKGERFLTQEEYEAALKAARENIKAIAIKARQIGAYKKWLATMKRKGRTTTYGMKTQHKVNVNNLDTDVRVCASLEAKNAKTN